MELDVLTFGAAVLAALAALYAARKSWEAADKLQTKDHAFQDRVRRSEQCDSLHEQFLAELLGADIPIQPPDKTGDTGTDIARMLIATTKIVFERANAASYLEAQIQTFCPGPAADAAEAVRNALNTYGTSLWDALARDLLSDNEEDFSGAQLAADTYRDALKEYQAAVAAGRGAA